MADNTYDDMAKALGMLYTLFLSDHGQEHTFSIARAQSNCYPEIYNLVDIDDGKYILNYVFNEVSSIKNFESDIDIVKLYTSSDLQLNKY